MTCAKPNLKRAYTHTHARTRVCELFRVETHTHMPHARDLSQTQQHARVHACGRPVPSSNTHTHTHAHTRARPVPSSTYFHTRTPRATCPKLNLKYTQTDAHTHMCATCRKLNLKPKRTYPCDLSQAQSRARASVRTSYPKLKHTHARTHVTGGLSRAESQTHIHTQRCVTCPKLKHARAPACGRPVPSLNTLSHTHAHTHLCGRPVPS